MMLLSTLKQSLTALKGLQIDRPKLGTLSGHAAGEPFEKHVYEHLKRLFPKNIFKQYEYLNDLYLKHPQYITAKQRYKLFNSPTVLFLISRGIAATKSWTPENLFEEKQNDTADIIYFKGGTYSFIDVKTRNISKNAQAPNIISAYKLAKMCANMIDNKEFGEL